MQGSTAWKWPVEKLRQSSGRAGRHKPNTFIASVETTTGDSAAIAVRSSEIELSLGNRVHSFQAEIETISRKRKLERGEGNIRVLHNGLFSRSLKRRKICSGCFRARRSNRRGEFIFESGRAGRAISREIFRQAGYRHGGVGSRAEREEKEITILFNIVVRSCGERALIGVRRRRAIGKRTFAYTSPYHFNGILNSRRRVPKLMQSQFPGSCAWYISDFPPLRYRLESSPSHAAVPERLVSPNNRLLPSAKAGPSACDLPPSLDRRFYAGQPD